MKPIRRAMLVAAVIMAVLAADWFLVLALQVIVIFEFEIGKR